MSTIYLGKPLKASQKAAASLSLRDINLARSAPSALIPVVTNDNIQPIHALYQKFLSCYVRAAYEKKRTALHEPFVPYPYAKLPPYFRNARIIWSYAVTLTPDNVTSICHKYGAEETMIKGKPAFVASLTPEMVRVLNGETPSPSTTTPSNERCMNISGYRSYLAASRMMHGILSTNQYPYLRNSISEVDDDNWSHGRSYLRYMSSDVSVPVTSDDSETSDWTHDILPRGIHAFSNNASPASDFQYTVRGGADLPSDHDGLIFPFVEELSLPDASTVPAFLSAHMFHAFGSDASEASIGFNLFKSGWGSIVGSSWEKELSHIAYVLSAALEAQSTVRIIVDNIGFYQGSVILGSQFNLTIGSTVYEPVSAEVLKADISKSSPHDASLQEIFKCILFADGSARQSAMKSCLSIHDLRHLIAVNGTTESLLMEVNKHATFLSFPNDPAPLPITAHNIESILGAIADPNANTRVFPLHPSCIGESSRSLRLLSAFGTLAPSFLCPGGKVMKLNKTFEAIRRGPNGKSESVPVTKIAVIVKPLRDAHRDLESVILNQEIHNPHGSTVVNRVSSSSLLRTFEKDSTRKVIAGLRKICNITSLIEGGSGKRKADEDEDDREAKKLRLFDL